MITEDELNSAKYVLNELMKQEEGHAYTALQDADRVLSSYNQSVLWYTAAENALDDCGIHYKNLEQVTENYFRFDPDDMILLEFLNRLENHEQVQEVYVSSEGDIRFRLK